MRIKFSFLILTSAALAAAAFTTIPAMAAPHQANHLRIPFSFTINGKNLPAGEYSLHTDSTNSFVILMDENKTRSFVWVAAPVAAKPDRAILRFHGEGETHVLESVQCGPLVTGKLDKRSGKTEDIAAPVMPGQ